MPFALPTYRPRDAEHTVLHVVIREYLETFLRETMERGEGSGLPQFVFHTLVLDGVFTTSALDAVQFHQVASPTDAEVAHLVATIRARILRLLGRRGLGPEADVSRPDPVVEESPVLAGLSSASVRGRVALARERAPG